MKNAASYMRKTWVLTAHEDCCVFVNSSKWNYLLLTIIYVEIDSVKWNISHQSFLDFCNLCGSSARYDKNYGKFQMMQFYPWYHEIFVPLAQWCSITYDSLLTTKQATTATLLHEMVLSSFSYTLFTVADVSV